MNINPTLKDLKMSVPIKPIIYKNVNKLSPIDHADRRDIYNLAFYNAKYKPIPEGPGEILKYLPPRQQFSNFKKSIVEDFRITIPSSYNLFYAKHKQPIKDLFRPTQIDNSEELFKMLSPNYKN